MVWIGGHDGPPIQRRPPPPPPRAAAASTTAAPAPPPPPELMRGTATARVRTAACRGRPPPPAVLRHRLPARIAATRLLAGLPAGIARAAQGVVAAAVTAAARTASGWRHRARPAPLTVTAPAICRAVPITGALSIARPGAGAVTCAVTGALPVREPSPVPRAACARSRVPGSLRSWSRPWPGSMPRCCNCDCACWRCASRPAVVASAVVVALVRAGNVLAELLLARRIAVGHAAPVGRVVLEVRLVGADLPVGVHAVVAVDVDVDVATAPVAVAPERRRGRHADAEGNARGERRAGVVAAVVAVVVGPGG